MMIIFSIILSQVARLLGELHYVVTSKASIATETTEVTTAEHGEKSRSSSTVRLRNSSLQHYRLLSETPSSLSTFQIIKDTFQVDSRYRSMMLK